jgi:outer membrane receptor for ferric coprogen and ferric-rhodotorulic acid
LDTEFSDDTAVGGSNLDGRSQAHAPNYQFYTGGEYLFGDGWFARVEVEGKDEFYFSNSHDQMSDSYALVNATVGYETTKWSIRLWGRNLSDEDYFVRGFYFGNDPRDLYQPNLWTQLGAPRQIGVSLQANF